MANPEDLTDDSSHSTCELYGLHGDLKLLGYELPQETRALAVDAQI
jgi:hypothetical protein